MYGIQSSSNNSSSGNSSNVDDAAKVKDLDLAERLNSRLFLFVHPPRLGRFLHNFQWMKPKLSPLVLYSLKKRPEISLLPVCYRARRKDEGVQDAV